MRRANMILRKKAGGGLIAGSQIATGLLDSLDKPDEFGAKSNSGAALSGLLSGASAGAALGPYGIAAGAVLGGVTSLLGNKKAIQERDRANQKKIADAEMNRQNIVDSRVANDPSLKTGNRNASLLKFGGTLKGTNAGKFSIGKVGSPIAGLLPDLLPDVSIRAGALVSKAKGGIIPTSSRTGLVVGPSHAEGGVKFPSKGVELEGKETTTADGFVFSQELGFAKSHEKIGKSMGKNERRPNTPEKERTEKAMVRQEGFLKLAQEATKKRMGLTNELDNSANKMRKEIGTQVMAKGGYMKLNGQDDRLKVLQDRRAALKDNNKNRAERTSLYNSIEAVRQSVKIPKGKPLPVPKSLYNFDSKLPQYLGSDGSNLKNLEFPKVQKTSASTAKPVIPTAKPVVSVAPVSKSVAPTKPIAPVSPTKPVVGKVLTPPVKKVFKADGKKKGKTGNAAPELSKELQGALKSITDFQTKTPTAAPFEAIGTKLEKINPNRLNIKSGIKSPSINPTKVDVPEGSSKFSKAIRNLGFDVKDTLGKADGALEKIAPFAPNIISAFRKLPQPPKLTMNQELTPALIDKSADRAEAVRQRRGADMVATQNLGTGNAVSATKAANLTQQIRATNAINQDEQNANTGIKNQFAEMNANIRAGNNAKTDMMATQQTERAIKEQELSQANMVNVSEKMQGISRDKKAADLEDDKLLLTIAQDDTGASIRAGDAILKRRLSPSAYTEMRTLADKMDAANAEDRKIHRQRIEQLLSNSSSLLPLPTILADPKTQQNVDKRNATKK